MNRHTLTCKYVYVLCICTHAQVRACGCAHMRSITRVWPRPNRPLQDGALCGFCETAVQYVKIALHNNQTIAQIEHAVDQLCNSAFAGLDAGPAQVQLCVF